MRIIAGKYKGRRLEHFKASHIRPTTDRVKESLFNILQLHIPESLVLDLFAGTGNLSIEALSRGANAVTSVELNPKSIAIINKNLQALSIDTGIEVIKADVFRFLQGEPVQCFDLIFVDPPFTEVLAHKVMQALADGRWLQSGGCIAIESAKKEQIEDNYGCLSLQDRRFYGDKTLSIFCKKQGEDL